MKNEVGRTQREYYLREQMKAIQKELGETDENTKEIDELREKIKEAKICLLGCGGLGTHLLFDLTATGFTNITIVDFDKIELSKSKQVDSIPRR